MNTDRTCSLLEEISTTLQEISTFLHKHSGLTSLPVKNQETHALTREDNLQSSLPNKETSPRIQESAVLSETTSLPPIPQIPLTLAVFFQQKNLTLRYSQNHTPEDSPVFPVALMLAHHYPLLRVILQKIRRSMQTGATFTEFLQPYSDDEAEILLRFCGELHRLAFLKNFRHIKSHQPSLRITTSRLPAAQLFFCGRWLEAWASFTIHHVHAELESATRSSILFEILPNAKIQFSNGEYCELDFLLQLNQQLLWVETKSGDFQPHISRLARTARRLALPPAQCILLLPDADANACTELSHILPFTITNLQSFPSILHTLAVTPPQ